jgi:hypothetical protein
MRAKKYFDSIQYSKQIYLKPTSKGPILVNACFGFHFFGYHEDIAYYVIHGDNLPDKMTLEEVYESTALESLSLTDQHTGL